MAAPAKNLPKVVVFNLPALLRFFKSVALAAAQLNNIHIVWKEYKESTVLNVVYALMPWKGTPGWAEVEMKWADVRANAEHLTGRYVEAFIKKCGEGPKAVIKYLEQLQKIRESALDSVREAFRSVSKINAEVIGEVDKGITTLRQIKAGSQLILAGTVIVTSGGTLLAGAGLGSNGIVAALAAEAGGASAVSFGFSISKAIVEGWSAAGDSQVLAVAGGEQFAKDLGDGKVSVPGGVIGETAKEASQHLAKGAATVLLTGGKYAERMAHLQRAAAEYERQLARARTANRQAKLQARLANRQGQMQNMSTRAGTKAAAAGAFLGIIFAGKDAYDALCELADTVK